MRCVIDRSPVTELVSQFNLSSLRRQGSSPEKWRHDRIGRGWAPASAGVTRNNTILNWHTVLSTGTRNDAARVFQRFLFYKRSLTGIGMRSEMDRVPAMSMARRSTPKAMPAALPIPGSAEINRSSMGQSRFPNRSRTVRSARNR